MNDYLCMGRNRFICHTELPYHITARCINRDWFSVEPENVWRVMATHLHFIHLAFGIRIHAFVLMSNHFHLIASAPNGNLSEAMRFFMSESGRDLRTFSERINVTYGSRFHRSLLSNQLYYQHAYKYLYRNPVMAGLCERVEDYRYSTLRSLLGLEKMEVPVCDDTHWETWGSRFATLEWLNTDPGHEDWEKIQKGLRRSVFKISPYKSRPSHLEVDAL